LAKTSIHFLALSFALCFGVASAHTRVGTSETAAYSRYLSATWNALAGMRAPGGLIQDTFLLGPSGELRPGDGLRQPTTPSELGLDLLVLAEALNDKGLGGTAREEIARELSQIAALPFHPDSGLLFSGYRAEDGLPVNPDVSSIDNLHLALALWTLAQAGESFSAQASALLGRLRFDPFLDRQRGVLGGNLTQVQPGIWQLDAYRYDYFGSESRSLYAVGAATGILGADEAFFDRAIDRLTIETACPAGRPIPRTWDGGTFQLFLPEILLGEHRYSRWLAAGFAAYVKLAIADGRQRDLPLPAAFSAAITGINLLNPHDPNGIGALQDPHFDEVGVDYRGQEGLQAISNRQIPARPDESAIALHAVLLAATIDPNTVATWLASAEAATAGSRIPLFSPTRGFTDTVRVQPDEPGTVGLGRSPLPVKIALDTQMEALSLFQILSPDGLSVSARALWENPATRRRLQRFYRRVDQRGPAAAPGCR
jgi:hypothetical protein